jgi:hypothetical protein
VRVLMRPFIDRQEFLWERVKGDEPEDWSVYERFVRQKIPLMLGTDDVRITGHHSDPEAGFFNGRWGRGARVVEAEVNLAGLPCLRDSQQVRVLRVVDFWQRECRRRRGDEADPWRPTCHSMAHATPDGARGSFCPLIFTPKGARSGRLFRRWPRGWPGSRR